MKSTVVLNPQRNIMHLLKHLVIAHVIANFNAFWHCSRCNRYTHTRAHTHTHTQHATHTHTHMSTITLAHAMRINDFSLLLDLGSKDVHQLVDVDENVLLCKGATGTIDVPGRDGDDKEGVGRDGDTENGGCILISAHASTGSDKTFRHTSIPV